MSWAPDICLYHDPCDDGFGAAWAVWKKWGDTVVFHGVNYGKPLPDIDYRGKHVLVVDFSFDPFKDELEHRYWRGARSLVFLDHHKTAVPILTQGGINKLPYSPSALAQDIGGHGIDGSPFIWAALDMERSGARMAWDWIHRSQPPKLIAYIEDRDLWRFSFPETRALSLYLRSFSMDFQTWDSILTRFDDDPAGVKREAEAIQRFYDRRLTEMADTASKGKIGSHEVPIAHVPYSFASDVANELLRRDPAAPFAACVVTAFGGRTYSLRSENSRADVSEVAKQFGGGGHRNAAGFRVPL